MNRLTNGNLSNPATAMDKSKDWQLEILMEKLRSKASQYKSLPEISKNVRMTMLEKRYALDSVEKSQHQKCLDTLQHSIKVTSLQSMVERLESLTRQLGLKFVVEASGVFISSDMFYLEIVLEPSGTVKDVKIHHEGKTEQQSCSELVNCLARGDFTDFTAQLEGFTSIYQLNAEKKVKCKAFTALESLEADLSTLSQLQLFMKEPFNLLHKSPVGILEKRKGGHPMKLTYFVSPYDLLNVEKADIEPLNIETVVSKSLGYSVTVCMEGSAAHKLQTAPLITVNRSMNGKSTPSYSQCTNQNSALIPACFVLKLNKPMPMSLSLVRQIQQIQTWTEIDSAPVHPLLSLIVSHTSDGKVESGNNKGLFVNLPDQNHCYFMTENKSMEGVLVNNIPFTHPAHVAKILMILREQALFNTVISSCVRPNSRQDFDNMTMFEVSALSSTQISISLEHPIEESMATAEIDLTDISNLICRIHNPGSPPPINVSDATSELGSRILNRCFSVPVTLRSVIKLWEKQAARRNHFNGHENFSLPLGSGDPGGHKGTSGSNMTEFGGLDGKIKQEPSNNNGHGMMMQTHQTSMFLNESLMANANFQNFPPSEGVLSNIELTNILSGTADKSSKRQKRKATDELWRGGKRKVGDDSELMESSSCDSTSRSTPLSQETEIATPTSVLGFQSDLELSGLDPTELLGNTDKSSAEFDNIDELGDVEEMLAVETTVRERRKSHDQKSPTISDLSGDKNLIPPTVSITPVSTASSPNYGGDNSNSEKRTGIEIFPMATSPSPLIPSSITITPITTQSKTTEEKSKEKKSSKSSRDDKNRLEKKRKRKRDESPMGPPEKVPLKQDPLTKPVSVSIKPAESPPLPPSTPTSPSMIRKFNASPTQNRTMSSISGKLSPNLMKSGIKSSSSSHHSPKHSPAHISSSPKHSIPGMSSPKSHGTSPKHPSTSGSGKPSMSTLKSATNSPSSKSSSESKSKSTSKESSRDKDKKLSSVFSVSSNSSSSSSGKTKSSVKVKPLDFNSTSEVVQDGLPSPSGTSDSSKSNPNQVRNRKGMLSAIVDKLKVNAQHCDSATDLSSKSSSGRERTSQVSSKSTDSSSSKSSAKIGENKNSEYMVKPSSDGMKITINKTRSKESKSSSSSLSKTSTNSSGSPKIHTGLKPGVNSGPASKKPQQLQKSSSSGSNLSNSTSSSSSSNYSSSSSNLKSSSSSKTTSSSSTKVSSSSSSGSISSKSVSKLTGSPKTSSSAADLSRTKDRPKPSRSSSDKSIFSSKDRKSSPTQSREDSDSVYKLTQSMIEGIMNKQLDKSFQIPKLSARTSDDKKSSSKSDGSNNINRSTVDSKIFDMMSKNDMSLPKYALSIPGSKMFDSIDPKSRNNMNNLNQLSIGATQKIKDDDLMDDKKKDFQQNLTGSQGKDEMYKLDPISASKSYSSSTSAGPEPLSLSTKSLDLSSKFVAPAPKDDKKDAKCKSDRDLILDFTSGKSDVNKGGSQQYPQSPSVSVHIVKSPSPMVNPSPHSASPCITDDELMDEALVGLGK